jgi:hypothetical protein
VTKEFLIENNNLIVISTPFKILPEQIVFDGNVDDDLRDSEKTEFSSQLDKNAFQKTHPGLVVNDLLIDPNDEDQLFRVEVNTRSSAIFEAGLSLGKTIFVCIVLTMGSLFFSKDANDLALRPIERMMNKVN